MSPRQRARVGAGERLQDATCDPVLAQQLVGRYRDLFQALQGVRNAGMPAAALAMVSEIEALVIALGQWLRDAGLEVDPERRG